MKSYLQLGLLAALSCTVTLSAYGQDVPTQVLVAVDAKSAAPAGASAVTVTVNGKKQSLTAWDQVTPANAQVALLIDDGLAGTALGRELDNLRAFIRTLPAGVEITVGYMHNNQVGAIPFNSDHELAASRIRLPQGMAGLDSNPYVSISFFVRNWVSFANPAAGTPAAASSPHKARMILLLTDGVDPNYSNGQESPFVSAAIEDAQRAGVAVNELYYSNGARDGGLTYLSRITQATGGANLWEGGPQNPVSTAPFLEQFQRSIAQTYIATFNAPTAKNPQKDLAVLKFSAPSAKLRVTERVRAGNQE